MRNIKSKAIKHGKTLATGAVVAGGAMANAAMAAGDDYSQILSGLDASTAILAVIGAGVLLAGVGFAKWATKKVATFFA